MGRIGLSLDMTGFVPAGGIGARRPFGGDLACRTLSTEGSRGLISFPPIQRAVGSRRPVTRGRTWIRTESRSVSRSDGNPALHISKTGVKQSLTSRLLIPKVI